MTNKKIYKKCKSDPNHWLGLLVKFLITEYDYPPCIQVTYIKHINHADNRQQRLCENEN